MRIGLELLSEEKTALQAGTFFETWLCVPRGVVGSSLGRDCFRVGRRLAQGARVCATGRAVVHGKARPGHTVSSPPVGVDVAFAWGEALLLGLRTNRFTHLGDLTAAVRLAATLDDVRRLECPLRHPLVQLEEVEPGRFLIELGGLLAASP